MKKAPRQRGFSATAQTLEQKRKLLLMVPETIPNGLDTWLLDWAEEVFAILDEAVENARRDPRHEARARQFIEEMVASGSTTAYDLQRETDYFARATVEQNLPDLPPLPELPSWAERWVTRITTRDVSVSAVSRGRTYKSWDAHVDQTVFFERLDDGSMDVGGNPPSVEITADDVDQVAITTADTVEVAKVIVAAGIDLAHALSGPGGEADAN